MVSAFTIAFFHSAGFRSALQLCRVDTYEKIPCGIVKVKDAGEIS